MKFQIEFDFEHSKTSNRPAVSRVSLQIAIDMIEQSDKAEHTFNHLHSLRSLQIANFDKMLSV